MTVVTYPDRKPINWHKPPGANAMVYYDQIAGDGVPIRGSLFAIASLDDLNTKALKQFGKPVHVIQPPFHTGYAPSAGTHDWDYCMDWKIGDPGDYSIPWLDQQWFGRINGWACWWRHTGSWTSASAQHIHGFPLPPGGKKFPTEVGIYVDGGLSTRGKLSASSQINDYWDHAEGLAGEHDQNDDPTKFPADIGATVFDLNAYIKKQQGEDMSYEDWTADGKAQYWADFKKFVTTEPVVDLKKNGKTTKTVSLSTAVQRDVNAEGA